MRRVRLLERSDLLRGQTQGERGYGILKMVRLGGSDDGGCDGRLAEQPGERELRTRNAALFGDLAQAIHDLMVRLSVFEYMLFPN